MRVMHLVKLDSFLQDHDHKDYSTQKNSTLSDPNSEEYKKKYEALRARRLSRTNLNRKPSRSLESIRKYQRNHRQNLVVDGKRLFRKAIKRPYPKNERCELCGTHRSETRARKLDYHHWRVEGKLPTQGVKYPTRCKQRYVNRPNNDPLKVSPPKVYGIWVCYDCHLFIEGIDKGLEKYVEKYKQLKSTIDRTSLRNSA